jgi:methylthioribose-1-phosphate isomerase
MEVIETLAATPDTAILWRDGRLLLLDQRALPRREAYLALDSAAEVAAAIRDMVVRGAPAIGISAAYGVVLGARARFAEAAAGWREALAGDLELLARARPTAVNLSWALARMGGLLARLPAGVDPAPALLVEAQAIHREDVEANHHMGELGAALIEGPTEVITHCNAGALATGGYGTALGVIRAAWAAGKLTQVLADETRPWLQGARLTAWELQRDGVPVTLLADVAAAARMARGGVGWVIVGSDRIAANGDVANKIGTYQLAVAARWHGVRFMVAAPTSTIDLGVASGRDIPIEERSPEEVLSCGGQPVGTPGVAAWNPVFDVTPAALVDAIVTERGVVPAPDADKLARLMGAPSRP